MFGCLAGMHLYALFRMQGKSERTVSMGGEGKRLSGMTFRIVLGIFRVTFLTVIRKTHPGKCKICKKSVLQPSELFDLA